MSCLISHLLACKPYLRGKPKTGGRVVAGKVSSKAGRLIPREVRYPTVLASPWCLLQVKSLVFSEGLWLGLRSPGEEPARSVCRWRPTASCKLQALPLHQPHPLPHQTVPRACLPRRHWDLGCAGGSSRQKMTRTCGMQSCLASALEGSTPLGAHPALPRKKSWSGPQMGLQGTLGDGLARRG